MKTRWPLASTNNGGRLRHILGSVLGLVSALAFACPQPAAQAQTAVTAGSGSYASFLPSGAAGDGTFYGPSIAQLGTLYNSLYIAPSLKSQAIPTNHWWTDLMTSFRQQTVNGVVSYTQSPFGDNLWVFPEMISPTASGMVMYYPTSWNPRPANGVVSGINPGPGLQVDAVCGGHSFVAPNPIVTGYGDWTVSYSITDSTTTNASITTYLARGVPFVWANYANTSPIIRTLGNPIVDGSGNPITASSFTASSFAVTISGKTFGVFAPTGTSFTNSGGSITANFGASGYLVYALMPDAAHLSEFAGYAYAEVTGSTMTWNYNRAAGNIATTWTLAVTPLSGTNTQTLQGWLPHHYHATTNNLTFKPYTYVTARGTLQVSPGNTFSITWPFRGMAPELPAPTDTGAATAPYNPTQMTNYVNQYVAGNHPTIVGETYGQGKELGQAASYMTMADKMGMTSAKSTILTNMESVLANWYTYTPGESSNYFGTLPNWGAIIGIPTSFGTLDFNDNHFHYGYYTLATALTGREDPTFLTNYGPMVTLVAKEYANWDRTDHAYPFLRTFDIWEGHSWAGGTSSPGGENQESSSEAVNSWVGLFMLGNMMNNSAMADTGAMGYAMETSAVNEYWQDFKHTNFPSTYGMYGTGILASQQIQYQNFFSADPVWEYAIQYVPINHWNDYLARDPVFLKNNLAAIFPERANAAANGISGFTLTDANNDFSVFTSYPGDYVLGAQLTEDPTATSTAMAGYIAGNLDIATSSNGLPGQVYYLAHTLRGLGSQDLTYYTDIPTSAVYYNASTGIRTAVIYNPLATTATATVYFNGTSITTVSVPARTTVTASVGGATTTLPTAPTGLTATAGNGQVSLSWTTVGAAVSYNIYRSSGAGSRWFSNVLTNSFTDTGLANGGNVYTYQVYAVNAAGMSQPSTSASARLIGTGLQTMVDYLNDFSMVSTVSAGMGINGSNAQFFNGDGARASRNPDDTESITYALPNITTFSAKVYVLNGPVSTVKFYTSVNNGSTYQALTVSYGTLTTSEFDKASAWGYYTVVPAVALPTGVTNLKIEFNAGTGNSWDPELSQVSVTYGGTPTTLTAQPTGLTATASGSQVNLGWTAVPGATGYTVYRTSLAGGVTYAGLTTNSFADTSVVSGVNYTYEVFATGANGTSIPSTPASLRFVATGVQTVTDPLSDLSIMSSATANIAMDTSNPQFFNGDNSRANRVADDTESIVYTFPNISNFSTLVYALNGPVSVVKLYTSIDNGTTYQLVTLSTSARGGPATGWGFYTITPAAALPAGVTNLKLELNAGTGNAWDPQVSQIAITFNGGGVAAPGQPQGLTATAGNTKVTLGWTATSGASSYNVYRSTSTGAETLLTTGLTGPSYIDSAVTNGTTYFYEVTAVNAGGTSPLSAEKSATPVAAEGPFGGTPAAIPGTVQSENYDTGGQGIAYNIATVNGTGNSYRTDGVDLEACTDTGGGSNLGWTAAGQWFKYTVNVATAGTYTVGFRVAATAVVNGALHLSNAGGTNLSGAVNVPNTGGWQTWTTVNTNVTLPAGQQILTVNVDAAGFNLNYLSFATAVTVPPAPTGLTASPSNAAVALGWTASTGASTYNVYRGTTAGGESTTPIITGLTATSYSNTGLTNGTTYFYKVAAVNTAGTSALSGENSATPTAGTTEAPFGGTPAAIPGTVQAENYDTGGEGVAYHDVDAANNGGVYRTDGVDIEACTDTGGGYNVGWTAAGEYMKYTVNVASAGAYTIGFRVAAPAAVAGAFHLTNAAGTNLTGAVAVPNTGGYQTWTTVNVNVTLAAGQQILTLNEDVAGYNLNYFSFTSTASTAVQINCGGTATGSWLADADFVNGTAASSTNAIDTSLLTGTVPPQSVLQTERYGSFTYTVPGFVASSTHTVTLYFAEEFWTAANSRTFNVSINGTSELTNFDIFATAGAANKAVMRSFTLPANASGQYVINFTLVKDAAKVDGISIN